MFRKLCLCLVLGLFILNPIKSLSQPTDCLDMFVYDPANNCTFVQTVQKWIYFPQYNNCGVQFTYRVYECEETNPTPPCSTKRKYKVFQMTGFNPDYGCIEIMQAVFPGYPNDFSYVDDFVMKELMSEAEKVISQELYLDHYNSLSQTEQAKLQCNGTYPNCSEPSIDNCDDYAIFFVQPTCYKFCISIIMVPPNIVIPYFYVVRCPEEAFGCCVTKRLYCVCDDGEGNTIINTVSYTEPVQGDCIENNKTCPQRTDPFGNGFHYETNCHHYCPTE